MRTIITALALSASTACAGTITIELPDGDPAEAGSAGTVTPNDAPRVPTEELLCASAGQDPTEVVLAAYAHDAAFLVRNDGSLVSLGELWETMDEGAIGPTVDVLAKGNHVAVQLSWLRPPSAPPFVFEHRSAVYNRHAEVVVTREGSGVEERLRDLAADGRTLVGRYHPTSLGEEAPFSVFDTQGNATDVHEFQPASPAFAGEFLAGWHLSEGAGWLDLGGAFHKVSSPGVRYGDGYVYVAGDPQSVLLETPFAVTPLSDLSDLPDGLFIETVRGDRAMLRGSDLQHAWEVHLLNGTVGAMDLLPPSGWYGFACGTPKPLIHSQGGVLLPFRNDGVAQLFHYEVETGAWRAVGHPVAEAGWLSALEDNGTVVIHARSSPSDFCTAEPWPGQAPADALGTYATQVLSPHSAEPLVLEPHTYERVTVHPSGDCIAYDAVGFEGTDVVDLATGEHHSLAAKGRTVWSPP